MAATSIRGPPVSQGDCMLLLLFSSTFALCATQGTRSQWLYSIEVAIGPAGTRPGPGPVLDARAFPVPIPRTVPEVCTSCRTNIHLYFTQMIYICRHMSSSLTGFQCSNCTRNCPYRLYLHHTIIHLCWKSCGLFVLLPEQQ